MLHPSLHGGDIRAASRKLGCRPEEILDFSASINPLGPPAWLRSVVAANLAGVAHYPEPRARSLRRAAACRLGLAEPCVTAGNGSSEILYAVVRAARNMGLRRAVLPAPCYED